MKENKLSKSQIDSIKNYANNIETIENFSAAIRKTSGMYISSLGNAGWLSCIREIFSNAVDQYLKPNSPCDFIEISYNEITKECTVIDNGLGIPHDIAVRVLTAQHTSSNYTKKKGEYSSGRHGVGMKVTLAFSEYFILESYVLGVGKRFEFHDGVLFKESDMKSVPMFQGTKVTFKPNETKDDEHMGPISITYTDVLNLVNGILPLMPIGTPIKFTGTHLTGKTRVYNLKNTDGLMSFMIVNCDKPLIKPISFSDDTGEIKGDVMFTYDLDGMSNRETIIAYGNYSPMAEMGTHVDGFLQGIERWFCNYMNKIYLASSKKKSKKALNVVPTDVRTGLVAVVSECVLKPIFKGQAKEAISNEELKPFFKELTMKALDEWSKTNPTALNKVCKYLKDVATIRVNADKEKVKISGKYSSSVFGGSLPSKYVQPTGTKDLELLIVEGDSALGSARNSRDKVHQGIFPIRGKMPNPIETTRAKYLANPEVSAIINIIGGGYGANFDMSKVKFKRIIIACFTGDTEVKLLDGKVYTFEQLAQMEKEFPGRDFWVYSYDPVRRMMVPGRGKNPRVIKYTDILVHVTLDNGKVIKCTPDHKFYTKDYGMVDAINLQPGTSLETIYTKINDEHYMYGREMVYDSYKQKWTPTHQRVMGEVLNEPEIISGTNIHHIDYNRLNNNPYNLYRWKTEEHRKIHAKITKRLHKEGKFEKGYFGHGNNNYNGSEKQKEHLKQLHKEGKYEHTYFGHGNNNYNGSEKQKENLRKAYKEGRILVGVSERIKEYNKTEANKESTRRLNQNEEVKILQKKGKYIRSGATLLRAGMRLTPELLSKESQHQLVLQGYRAFTYDKIMEAYDNFEDYIFDCVNYPLTDDEFKRYSSLDENARKESNILTKKNCIAKAAKWMLDHEMDFNEENYNEARRNVCKKGPKFNSIWNYYKDMQELMEAACHYNHKVMKVEIEHLDEPIPVYCMEVEKYHNFAIRSEVDAQSTVPGASDSGVIVKNCDGDYDGYHIRTLIFKLFLYYMPQMVEAGMIYSAVPPLYGLLNNKNEVQKYFTDRLDFTNYLSKKFHKSYDICDSKNSKLSSNDVSNIFYTNHDYKEELDILSARYALNPLLIELVIMKLIDSKDNKDLYKKLKKSIKSEFRFMDVCEQDEVIIIDGIINSESNTLALNNQFIKDSKVIIDRLKTSKYKEFVINGNHCRLYELFDLYDKFTKSQGNVRRYKGLGEMNPEELAESTIRPDGKRCLIRYTLDDAKQLQQQIRTIESDRSKLLDNVNNYQISKEDLLG